MLENEFVNVLMPKEKESSLKRRSYYAKAQRKSRKLKKIERQQLIERNSYLETLNPKLREKLELLREEYCQLNNELPKEDQELAVSIDMKYNRVLKERVAQNRNYRSAMFSVLQKLNEKALEQDLNFISKQNFYRLMTRLPALKLREIPQLKTTLQLTDTSLSNVSINMFQDKREIMGREISVTRYHIDDIPISADNFFNTHLATWNDKVFINSLIKTVIPEHAHIFEQSFSQEVELVSQEDLFVRTANVFGVKMYYMIGWHIEGSGEDKTYSIVNTLMSDYTRNIEECSTDPRNTHGYIIKPGKDRDHCNVTVISHVEHTISDEKFPNVVHITHSMEHKTIPKLLDRYMISNTFRS